MTLLAGFIAAGISLSIIMAGAWKVQRVTANSGWIDVIWTLGTGAVACALALLPLQGQELPGWRQLVAAAFAAIWSLRLAWHIAGRTRRVADDPRYRAKLDSWGPQAASRLFWFLQAQAAVALVLAAAVMLAAHQPHSALRWQDALAMVLFGAGAGTEALADGQLRRFKARAADREAVCDVGLWRYSRHPNYFGEWLCWCAWPLLAIGDGFPQGWLALPAPLLMYWTLVYASGIPPLEAHMAKSRPRAFAAYKRRTNAFFPGPPRQG